MIYTAAPAYTIKGTGKKAINQLNNGYQDCSPGPKYNMFGQGIKTRTLSYSPSKFRRTQVNEGVIKTPGPLDYNPQKNFQNTKVSFPKSQRKDENIKNNDPDPTAYRPLNSQTKQKILQYSMGSKYPSIMDNTGQNPGPADYEKPETLTSQFLGTRKSKFGTGTRLSQPNLTPGPGDYKITQQKGLINGKGSIGNSQRMKQQKNLPPGPTQYSHRSAFDYNKSNAGKSFGKKFEGVFNTNSDTVNSFNNYFKDRGSTTENAKTFSIGKQKRQIFKGQDIPGPSDYQSQDVKKNTPNACIPKHQFKQYNDIKDNPGPGSYESKQFNSKNYSIPRSKSIDIMNTNPGSGKYEVDRGIAKQKDKGNMIGKSKRTNFSSNNKAGVGDYDILKKKTGGISIPKAERFAVTNKNPGPGDYNNQTTISNFHLYKKTF